MRILLGLNKMVIVTNCSFKLALSRLKHEHATRSSSSERLIMATIAECSTTRPLQPQWTTTMSTTGVSLDAPKSASVLLVIAEASSLRLPHQQVWYRIVLNIKPGDNLLSLFVALKSDPELHVHERRQLQRTLSRWDLTTPLSPHHPTMQMLLESIVFCTLQLMKRRCVAAIAATSRAAAASAGHIGGSTFLKYIESSSFSDAISHPAAKRHLGHAGQRALHLGHAGQRPYHRGHAGGRNGRPRPARSERAVRGAACYRPGMWPHGTPRSNPTATAWASRGSAASASYNAAAAPRGY